MKFFFTLLLTSVILFSCTNNKSVREKPLKRTIDTSKVFGMYLGYNRVGTLQGVLTKFKFDSVIVWDSIQKEFIWTDDSTYIGDMYIPVKDSLTAKVVGIKQWNNRDTVVVRSNWVNSKYVVEAIIDIDSASKYLIKLMDTTKAVVDSTKK